MEEMRGRSRRWAKEGRGNITGGMMLPGSRDGGQDWLGAYARGVYRRSRLVCRVAAVVFW